ncbi:hypothetical protein HHK36_031567 [Tetracentron sinense]|uniref:Uncharacterized protein n=1 Tax=Tetracentron sinense TaxID=13715 RepID=A0A835D0C6_TETSI|nr:hypothetical protein HHK36_031567 [Tetracentron sinense]
MVNGIINRKKTKGEKCYLYRLQMTIQVNQALLELIKASEMKLSAHDWSNLPKKDVEVDYESEENASLIYAAIVVDKEELIHNA